MIVAVVGSPLAIVGAVYTPPALIVPPFVVVTAQVTAELLVLVTVAVKVAVCGGQLSAASFGYSVTAEGLDDRRLGLRPHGALRGLRLLVREPPVGIVGQRPERASQSQGPPTQSASLSGLRPASGLCVLLLLR